MSGVNLPIVTCSSRKRLLSRFLCAFVVVIRFHVRGTRAFNWNTNSFRKKHRRNMHRSKDVFRFLAHRRDFSSARRNTKNRFATTRLCRRPESTRHSPTFLSLSYEWSDYIHHQTHINRNLFLSAVAADVHHEIDEAEGTMNNTQVVMVPPLAMDNPIRSNRENTSASTRSKNKIDYQPSEGKIEADPKLRKKKNESSAKSTKKKSDAGAKPKRKKKEAVAELDQAHGVSEEDIMRRKEVEAESDIAHGAEEEDIIKILKDKGIKSRPVPGGVWNVKEPLKWTENFGRRSPHYEENILKRLICLKPGDEGYFDVSNVQVPKVTIVRTKEQAVIVLEKLNNADPAIFHACDTEVMDIDLNSVGPVGNGYVTCLSMYSGPDFDYGLGGGPGTTLWIDNLDDACGILLEFKEWFENEKFLKVWHNYGFDRHVMWNEGIDVKGFGGDTMHMARLYDTSRGKGYSLESLTNDFLKRRKQPMKELFGVRRLRKDGSDAKLVDIPPVEVLQRDPTYRTKWITYSSFDAEGTWLLRAELEEKLKEAWWRENDNLFTYYWLYMRPFGEVLTDMERRGVCVDAVDYLANVEIQARRDRERHYQVFRRWAEEKIGPAGLALNVASALQMRTFLFGGAEIPNPKDPNKKEIIEAVRVFKVPREEIPEDALEAYRLEEAEKASEEPEKAPHDQLELLDSMKVSQLKELCKEMGLKSSGKKSELQDRIKEHCRNGSAGVDVQTLDDDGLENMTLEDLCVMARGRNLEYSGTKQDLIQLIRDDIEQVRQIEAAMSPTSNDGYIALSKLVEEAAASKSGVLSDYLAEMEQKAEEVPKYVEVTVKGIGLVPEKLTAGGMPSVTADVLRTLAGNPFADPPKYGSAHEKVGDEGCKALFSLCSIGSIDTMITNFLTSLQELADDQSRVHCSLNLNTETGRLSSRRPNLQNQPALEKDKYKIRKAFQASSGNNLIVADYGQLELRILASLTKCIPMIDAFAAGGDFHSRTAMDMFPYVRKAVEAGDCLLEWDYSKGEPNKPMLKDVFASERRKAKTLNFSIAYGKTAHGLSQDWGVTKKEAEEMLQAWYEARPQVKNWQDTTKNIARKEGYTRTLMGRYRQLPSARGNDQKLLQHALRASINTPIQGGAADIAMMAMNKINANTKLKDLGWILLLQIHDEVMLEGPEETAEEAFEEVIKCMEEPWVYGLEQMSVPLTVDGSWKHKTWYDAK